MKLTKVEKKISQITQNQNITISKGLLRDMGDQKININYSPIMVVTAEGVNGAPEMSSVQDMLWAVLDALPEPKLTNLRRLAIETCISKTKGVTAAADYLNMQRTYISREHSISRKAPLQLNEGVDDGIEREECKEIIQEG